MLSLLTRSSIRTVSAVNLVNVVLSKRFLTTSRFESEPELDEKNCPKSKAFDDLLENKKPSKGKLEASDKKGKDYPFELEDEDYVIMVDPKTGEWNPPRGVFNNAEPTRYGDWEIKGRCYDF